MPENAIIPDGEAVPETVKAETAREKFERERLSRRQALKRLGMTSAMATFALFSVDDLARMVGKAMQQRVGDNKVAAQIAKEFQQAGIALAQPGTPCSHCANQYDADYKKAKATWTDCVGNWEMKGVDTSSAMAICDDDFCKTMNYTLYDFNGCCAVNCINGCLPYPMPEECAKG